MHDCMTQRCKGLSSRSIDLAHQHDCVRLTTKFFAGKHEGTVLECKKLKTGVQLPASDDRLCQDCYLANQTAIANIRRDEQNKANVTPQSKAAAAATASHFSVVD
jgi:hypothetical protein